MEEEKKVSDESIVEEAKGETPEETTTEDGTEAKGKKCPNCGNETLVYQEGCLICTTCGASRCG